MYLNPTSFRLTAIAAGFLGSMTAGAGEDPVAQFEREVRPILEQRCFECHGPNRQKSGLRLDQKSALLEGGDSGEPAVVPGKSAESKLIKLVTATDPKEAMPAKGERLTPEQIEALKRWIDTGAHWPALTPAEIAAQSTAGRFTEKDRAFWAFQPPRHAEVHVPGDVGWVRQPLDRFILAKLRERGLEPAPEASPATLIRRLTFDLTGLPPTPEEVDAFLQESVIDYQLSILHLTDRLLASPRFGERMASLWLPLARFAEDQAHQVGEDTKFFYPNAHHYRTWVIEAFNRDLRYDQFLKLQLAADKLPATPQSDLAALGFLGLGPKYYNRNRTEVMADEWEDRVDTVTRTMMGLTVACARCHDHKFDPVSTRDYYALAGVFASTRMINKRPDGQVEKEGTKADKMDPGTLHIVEDGDLQNLNIFLRGNVEQKGAVAERGFIEVLSPGPPPGFSDGSGRRELAEAIASCDNPLTARVFVNRVWGALMGRPLVATPSNFGHSGERPTHPELLDDLALRFMDSGWSVKGVVREIALSATYRQGSGVKSLNRRSVRSDEPASGAGAVAIQRSNDSTIQQPNDSTIPRFHDSTIQQFYGSMPRRRLSVEQWRDAVLAVTGELAETPGAKSKSVSDPDNFQRTVYAGVSRLQLNELLIQFDYPDANVHAERRSATTTPMQKLFVLNSPFMQKRAAALATRLHAASPGDEDGRITLAYRLLFSREPDGEERTLARKFLNGSDNPKMQRWEQYAQLLLASNEMLYVD